MLLVFVCLALGGILKGATGAGAPLVAVPALAMLVDVKFAVTVMVMPSLFTNLTQAWLYREHRLPRNFMAAFVAAGILGVVLGSYVLASLSQDMLSLIVALAVFAYIGFRLLRPDWVVSYAAGRALSVPMGIAAGILQGAAGISSPAAVTFLNAMRLDRPVFIGTISTLFFAMTLVQLPALGYLGLMDAHRILLSVLTFLPILAFMPVGERIARRLSKRFFDNLILCLLAIVATKLVFSALA
ncbi:sulfite exporter TauE/SafE family protein [Propylenella binzhouense]|uniref:Probable membrane transporter protein n=1 Tax=Propylenella binzhouense TaxID=2555902 RepID=A0A964WV41_9HYPH|nr:sulfite exporter TauE/SafE family protein [Propylenella binzhouense]MYZ49475.1 sulfite exporter TauE/SafE family protein [Propylenella binzhouense]